MWTQSAQLLPEDADIISVPGMWFSGDDVFKRILDGAIACNLTTGRQHWKVPTPSTNPCEAADNIVNNKVAVEYGKLCDGIVIVDAPTGRVARKKQWATSLDDTSISVDVAMSGDAVVMTTEGTTPAFYVSIGKELWRVRCAAPSSAARR